MDNGEWIMDNGEWIMDNGEWIMGEYAHFSIIRSPLNLNVDLLLIHPPADRPHERDDGDGV
jgi:hypothetical protein